VDELGIAWVSGRAHVRGFWTQGNHLNPISGQVETATACDPIPYAGGGTKEGALPSDIMHNAWHEPGAVIDGRAGDVVVATEENTVTDCAASGRLVTYDIGASHHGEGFVNIATTHFRLKTLDTWTPKDQPGSTGCDSAHWFTERADQVLAISFYTQGTRFLDVSNPRHVRQVGYYNPQGTDSWAAYWHGRDTVLVADFTRGLDVLRFHGATAGAQHTSLAPVSGDATVRSLPRTAPQLPAAPAIAAILLLAGVAALAHAVVDRQRRRGTRAS
ncbi:MAG: hypothetical protein M3010_09205, partial [Candidatus Dormibacteraeota bacterium]|nr:hypothetical protein [Candidatus Dormibacteraeota bacterium]